METSQVVTGSTTAPAVPDRWVTKEIVAHHLGIGLRTVNSWMKRRILPYTKVGRVVRFNLAECDAAMRKYQTQSRNN